MLHVVTVPQPGSRNAYKRHLPLGLRVGDRVRVRDLDEILFTLDEEGCLESLPFMPEMRVYCGQEFRVLKRIDKVNDTVDYTGLRRMSNSVILEGVRCDGGFHGGCQALCQIIWKESWLTRVEGRHWKIWNHLKGKTGTNQGLNAQWDRTVCTPECLMRATQRSGPEGEQRFFCQATEIKKASVPLAWWDVRQYWRDLYSGNVSSLEIIRGFLFWSFTLMLQLCCYRLLISLYNRLQKIRGGDPYPYNRWGVLEKTPTSRLNLTPGEFVRVKSYDEILATLNTRNRNRGLWFDEEMVKYCGGTYKVLCRVERIIDHKTGKLVTLQNDCIVLKGVTVRGDYHRFYPQNEYPLWREVWLERLPSGCVADPQGQERKHAQESDQERCPPIQGMAR